MRFAQDDRAKLFRRVEGEAGLKVNMLQGDWTKANEPGLPIPK